MTASDVVPESSTSSSSSSSVDAMIEDGKSSNNSVGNRRRSFPAEAAVAQMSSSSSGWPSPSLLGTPSRSRSNKNHNDDDNNNSSSNRASTRIASYCRQNLSPVRLLHRKKEIHKSNCNSSNSNNTETLGGGTTQTVMMVAPSLLTEEGRNDSAQKMTLSTSSSSSSSSPAEVASPPKSQVLATTSESSSSSSSLSDEEGRSVKQEKKLVPIPSLEDGADRRRLLDSDDVVHVPSASSLPSTAPTSPVEGILASIPVVPPSTPPSAGFVVENDDHDYYHDDGRHYYYYHYGNDNSVNNNNNNNKTKTTTIDPQKQVIYPTSIGPTMNDHDPFSTDVTTITKTLSTPTGRPDSKNDDDDDDDDVRKRVDTTNDNEDDDDGNDQLEDDGIVVVEMDEDMDGPIHPTPDKASSFYSSTTTTTDSEGAAHRSELQQVLDDFVEAVEVTSRTNSPRRTVENDDDDDIDDGYYHDDDNEGEGGRRHRRRQCGDPATVTVTDAERMVPALSIFNLFDDCDHNGGDHNNGSLTPTTTYRTPERPESASTRRRSTNADTTMTMTTPTSILKAKEALEELVDPDQREVLSQTIAVALLEVHPDQRNVILSTLSDSFRQRPDDDDDDDDDEEEEEEVINDVLVAVSDNGDSNDCTQNFHNKTVVKDSIDFFDGIVEQEDEDSDPDRTGTGGTIDTVNVVRDGQVDSFMTEQGTMFESKIHRDGQKEQALEQEMHLLEDLALSCRRNRQTEAEWQLHLPTAAAAAGPERAVDVSTTSVTGIVGDVAVTEDDGSNCHLDASDQISDCGIDVKATNVPSEDSMAIARTKARYAIRVDRSHPPSATRGVPLEAFLLLLLFLCSMYLMRFFASLAIPQNTYDLDVLNAQAAQYFHNKDESSSASVTDPTMKRRRPMDGVVVIMSEMKSKLGTDIAHRLNMLGATVVSVKVDCTDLGSVSKSVDAIVAQYDGNIDFLVHTGYLCLEPSLLFQWKDAVMLKPTVQGFDRMFGGNYMSTFLLTQKLIPYLERSKFGTIVQFTSPVVSGWVDGSKLEPVDPLSGEAWDGPPAAAGTTSNIRRKGTNILSSIMALPEQYANVKLAESLHIRVLTRIYPNLRLIDVPHRQWLFGSDVRAFLETIFHDDKSTAPSTSLLSSVEFSDPTDQEVDLYIWSQRAISRWVGNGPKAGQLDTGPLGWQVIETTSITSETTTTTRTPSNIVESFLGPTRTFLVGGALTLAGWKIKEFVWK